MAQTNVAQFAKELGVPAAMLLEQLQAAGVGKALVEDTPLSEQDKTQLLEYLQRVHGTKESKNKITLTRKQTSEIKKADATGRSRTIQVEVRKKRVFVKREATAASGEVEAVPAAPTFDVDQTALREEEARKQAELISRQAAEAAAKTERDRKRKPVEEREVREAPPPVAPSVTSFTLINADDDQPITGYNPIANGATLNLAMLPTRRLNIRADTDPALVGSVRFAFDGATNYRTDNAAPYALGGDTGTDYMAWTPSVGTHTVTATPYSAADASGTSGTAATLTFRVTDKRKGKP